MLDYVETGYQHNWQLINFSRDCRRCSTTRTDLILVINSTSWAIPLCYCKLIPTDMFEVLSSFVVTRMDPYWHPRCCRRQWSIVSGSREHRFATNKKRLYDKRERELQTCSRNTYDIRLFIDLFGSQDFVQCLHRVLAMRQCIGL